MTDKTRKEYALGFMFIGMPDSPTHVVLIKKARPEWQRNKLNGVGGKLNVSTDPLNAADAESPLGAMVREFREETGVVTESDEWRHRATMVYPEANIFVFSAFRTYIRVHQLTDEEVQLVDLRSLDYARTVPNLRWLIPLVLDRDVTDALCVPCQYVT